MASTVVTSILLNSIKGILLTEPDIIGQIRLKCCPNCTDFIGEIKVEKL